MTKVKGKQRVGSKESSEEGPIDRKGKGKKVRNLPAMGERGGKRLLLRKAMRKD